MTTHDLACFENWLEQYATPEEQELPYAKQLEMHILWLSGFNNDSAVLEQIPVDQMGEPQ